MCSGDHRLRSVLLAEHRPRGHPRRWFVPNARHAMPQPCGTTPCAGVSMHRTGSATRGGSRQSPPPSRKAGRQNTKTLMPSHFEERLGYPRVMAGIAFGLPSIAGLIVVFTTSGIGDRLPTRGSTSRAVRGIIPAMCLLICGILLAVLPYISVPWLAVAVVSLDTLLEPTSHQRSSRTVRNCPSATDRGEWASSSTSWISAE